LSYRVILAFFSKISKYKLRSLTLKQTGDIFMEYFLADATMKSLVLSPYLIVIKDPKKKSGVNIITISYLGVLCENPPIISLAIRPTRHSYSLLQTTKEFTVCIPCQEDLKIVDYCGTISGKKHDKANELGLVLEKAEVINGFYLTNSPITLECRVKNILTTTEVKGTHNAFIADVLAYHYRKGFEIENFKAIATTNYDYRAVDSKLGTAHKIWHQKTKGG
jgi:flavin reductase (DIM6/NTAB) family NADH-FMN oxidoreductase RutF